MEIEWTIEEFADEPYDCLGSISIKSENGEISVDCAYIDSWLYALGNAIVCLQDDMKEMEIDLFEESGPLSIIPSSEGLFVLYKKSRLFVKTLTEYKSGVSNAIQRYIDNCYSSGTHDYNPQMIKDLKSILKNIRSN